jgi:hypothetical protein
VTETKPSQQLVLQRVRNRIIEYLETTSSLERQRVPHVVPGETINSWEDSVLEPWLKQYVPPVFSDDERQAILSFHRTWDAVSAGLAWSQTNFDELAGNPEWERLRTAAASALAVFQRRGKCSEDEEISS